MTHINQRRDTSANWTSSNPILQLGEVGHETNTRKYKLGDGVTHWNDLQYSNPAGVISVAGKTGVVTLTKADVGLGSVNDTADVDKPVSGPQQTALNLKANLASPALTGNPTAPTQAGGNSSTRIANTAFVAGEIATARTSIDLGLTKKFHGARVKQSSGQVISNNTLTALSFNTEDFDTDAFHDNSTNPTRLTVPAGMGGYYRCVASVGYTAAWTAANFSDIHMYKTGSETSAIFRYVPINDFGGLELVTPPILLAAGDYMEARVKQQAGANRTTDINFVTFFSIEWLGAA